MSSDSVDQNQLLAGFQSMFTTNPFAELSAFISSGVIQAYIVTMIVLVVAGTLYDVVHKKSARYFVDNWRNETSKGSKRVSGGEIASMAVKTLLVEVLMSAEFCNAQRKIAHLLTMYGFVVYLIATLVMVFNYPISATPAPGIWAFLWHLGALSVCIGGYWFWFFIRVDGAAGPGWVPRQPGPRSRRADRGSRGRTGSDWRASPGPARGRG